LAKKTKQSLDNLISDWKEFVAKAEDERELNPISTGSLSMDVSTGIGGIPRYRWSNIWGPKSAGKTTLALTIAKGVIENGGKVLYIDIESGLDFGYIATIVGELNDSFILIQPETSEQAFKIAESAIESNELDLIIFDSIGALAPKKEKEDNFEDANVALVSRELGKFLRRNSSRLRWSEKTAFLFTNQVRDNIGSYISGYVQPGGHQLEHFVSLEIRLYSAKKIKKNDAIIGTATKFTISKNKCAIPYRSSELYITFGKGVDVLKDVVMFSELLGILKKRGSFYYLDDTNIGQGVDNAIGYLEENPETLDKIRKMCYNIVIGDTSVSEGSLTFEE
jgi:recombination protein RecA